MTNVLIVIGFAIVIVLLIMNLMKKDHTRELSRIEKGIEDNTRTLLEDKANKEAYEKSFAMILSETMKTREYLGVSDAKLSRIATSVIAMNNIMVNNKKRGNFGEYTLYHLLSIYFGESDAIYETQFRFNNGKIADAVLHIPGSDRVLAIDSKFPVENYARLDDAQNHDAKGAFRRDVKKHIHDIASKYIGEETLEEAIMFIPSEAIYLYICQEESSLIDEAYKAHVLITSPSTLMGVAFTLINITKDFKRSQNLQRVEKEIVALKENSDRMRDRYERVENTLQTLLKQYRELGISVHKIDERIGQIYDGED
ncbi:MAG TPA: DNA recombination protein RmuC [Erysipelotrichaceae bacterium]|nr:DNA recombination protein RmuC [Erysipelotrichaceae bacterium]